MAKTLPGERSLQYLRKEGWWAFTVERWIQQARKRIDVAGFGDILAWRGSLTALVQTTTRTNVGAHRWKIASDECYKGAKAWLTGPNRVIILHGWWKQQTGSMKKPRWRLNEEVWTLKDIQDLRTKWEAKQDGQGD